MSAPPDPVFEPPFQPTLPLKAMPHCSVPGCETHDETPAGWAACHHCGALLCPTHAMNESNHLRSDPAFPGEVPAHHCKRCRERFHPAKTKGRR